MEDRPGIRTERSPGEKRVYLAIFAGLLIVYTLSGIIIPRLSGDGVHSREALFGFSQIGCYGLRCLIIGIAIPLAVLAAGRALSAGRLGAFREKAVRVFNSAWFRASLPVLLAVVFFLLRNNFVNYDGSMFAEKFARDVPVLGAHVTHDEMWELYLHSRFWLLTNRMFGWSVELSYQVLSSIAGGAYILLLMYYCSLVLPGRPVLAFLIGVSGGYMQLFFGDVENYTMTTTLIMVYFLGSALFIQGRRSLVLPSAALAAALTFHLLAGFLIPSLLVLFSMAWKRGERLKVWVSAGLFVTIVGGTLLFFHLHNLPIRDLWYNSHAFGHGGHIRPHIVDPSPGYYFKLLNLAFLLAPASVLIVPLLIFGRIRLDGMNSHLITASAFMGFFFLVWKATLGVYPDWNMFAAAALPFTLLVMRNILSADCIRGRCWVAYLFAWLFMLHSYSWVIYNHFHGRHFGM